MITILAPTLFGRDDVNLGFVLYCQMEYSCRMHVRSSPDSEDIHIQTTWTNGIACQAVEERFWADFWNFHSVTLSLLESQLLIRGVTTPII